MSRRFASLALAAAATLAACGESPTSTSDETPGSAELVITQGAPAPAPAPRALRPSLSSVAGLATLDGSVSTPLSLKPQSCDPGQQVNLVFSISGAQAGTASFKVNTSWQYNGTAWSGTSAVTVSAGPRAGGDPATIRTVPITVVNASSVESGTSSFAVTPFDPTNSNATGAKLNLDTGSSANVYVAFADCPVTNTPPTLQLPPDMTIEATSSAGAAVSFTVTASDLEDGDLTGSVSCTPTSGSTFALGTTTVNCSVTDTDGVETVGSFEITVEDITPAHFTSFPTSTVNLIATDINGAVLDLDALGITVEDVNNVSEPSTFACDYVAGTALGIGSTTEVSCTAKDNLGNESDPSVFEVFVGLNVAGTGFLPPLRMVAPFSAHKRGSTIPHKFLPPTYADGTPALDLAGDLRLVIQRISGLTPDDELLVNDYTAGSTAWRYDVDGGQYIFNLKTGTSTPWDAGIWTTTVSYKGIALATTQFELRR
jgi:hypothetical protein